ncbi:MAG: glyoxalase [Euryarchaeota archaeon]|nr:glyoxalase [Euryarchaeota archaeon]|tara:strand:- start:117 stop:533 length:417 start_codon:yes stop_codon:yes gene_type:complete
MRPFHLAFPVINLEEAIEFYTDVLGCITGRRKEESCVLNLFGHQIVAHIVPEMPSVSTNPVDGKRVPAMHFGVVLTMDDWYELRRNLQMKNVDFVIGPYERYQGTPGAQATMFVKDPSGNHIEFKAFADDKAIFDDKW